MSVHPLNYKLQEDKNFCPLCSLYLKECWYLVGAQYTFVEETKNEFLKSRKLFSAV